VLHGMVAVCNSVCACFVWARAFLCPVGARLARAAQGPRQCPAALHGSRRQVRWLSLEPTPTLSSFTFSFVMLSPPHASCPAGVGHCLMRPVCTACAVIPMLDALQVAIPWAVPLWGAPPRHDFQVPFDDSH